MRAGAAFGTDGTLRIRDLHSGTGNAAIHVARPLFGCARERGGDGACAVGAATAHVRSGRPKPASSATSRDIMWTYGPDDRPGVIDARDGDP